MGWGGVGGAGLPGIGIRKVALRRSVVTGWEGVWRSEVAVNRKGGEGRGELAVSLTRNDVCVQFRV